MNNTVVLYNIMQATVTAPVYRNILVNVSGSQSQRVTFDACEGSNEHHYWDHHAGITQLHTTGLCMQYIISIAVTTCTSVSCVCDIIHMN